MIGGGPGGEDTPAPDDENTHRRSRSAPGGSRHNREDEELQKALEASKQSAELEAQKTALSAEYVDPSFPGPTCHFILQRLYRERDLQRAIKLSEEEEAKRAKAVEEANSKSLFEDSTAQADNAQAAYVVPQFAKFRPVFLYPHQQHCSEHESFPTCRCERSSATVYTPAAIYSPTTNYIIQSLSCPAAARGPTVGLGSAAAGVAAARMATTASRAAGSPGPGSATGPERLGHAADAIAAIATDADATVRSSATAAAPAAANHLAPSSANFASDCPDYWIW